MKIMKKILPIIKTTLVVLLISIMVFVLAMRITGNNPSILGFNLYYIATPSMEPDLKVGDIILSKNVKDYSKLEIHDVVTYEGKVGSYANKLITHEIVDIKEENGKYSFLTKGIKEGATVDPEISEEQVKSKMLCKIPLLGQVVKLFNNRIVFFLCIIIPLSIMLVYEVANLVKISKSEDDEGVENEKK